MIHDVSAVIILAKSNDRPKANNEHSKSAEDNTRFLANGNFYDSRSISLTSLLCVGESNLAFREKYIIDGQNPIGAI